MKDELNKAIDLIMERGRINLIAQGHDLTGNLIKSFEKKVTEDFAEFYGEHYGLAQETGVKPGQIKISRAYIERLTEWVRIRGIEQGIKARGVAFAIANRHILTGMHTRNKISRPELQGWLSDAAKEVEPELDLLIEKGAEKQLVLLLDKLWDENKRNI